MTELHIFNCFKVISVPDGVSGHATLNMPLWCVGADCLREEGTEKQWTQRAVFSGMFLSSERWTLQLEDC